VIEDKKMGDMAKRVLRVKEVLRLLGISRATLFRLRRRGDFPPAVRLSTTAIGFRDEDFRAWVDSRLGK
jgi:prophage regulatory protein